MRIPAIIKDPAMRVMSRTHQAVFDATRGRVFGGFFGMPSVKLTTTGRKSGKRRDTMLTSPTETASGEVVLVASNGGDDRNPAWYLNLLDQPEVELTMRGRRFTATARTADPDERAALLPKVKRAFFGYRMYPQMTDREIPLVICSPTD